MSQNHTEMFLDQGIDVQDRPDGGAGRTDETQPRLKRGPIAVLFLGAVATLVWMLLLPVGVVWLVGQLWSS